MVKCILAFIIAVVGVTAIAAAKSQIEFRVRKDAQATHILPMRMHGECAGACPTYRTCFDYEKIPVAAPPDLDNITDMSNDAGIQYWVTRNVKGLVTEETRAIVFFGFNDNVFNYIDDLPLVKARRPTGESSIVMLDVLILPADSDDSHPLVIERM